eukprot:scaffold358817_cov39-Prasinocladus_malaysianus.AAC.1
MVTPRMSMMTCIVVPALAGSSPILAIPNGSDAPATTEVKTMQSREIEMAVAFQASPLVTYTLTQPPAARPPPRRPPTAACCATTFWIEAVLDRMLPVA